MPIDRADLDDRFVHHPPFGDQAERRREIRGAARALAELIVTAAPAGREQSLAITKLEEAVMWADKAIAVRERPTSPPILSPGGAP